MNPGELLEFFFFWGKDIHSSLKKKDPSTSKVMDIFPGRLLFSSHFWRWFSRRRRKKTADEQQNTRGINTNIWLCQTGEKSLGHVSKRPRMWGVLAMI